MTLLLPHFRRAVAIGKMIDLHKVEAAALADTLDGLAAAMFLVDAGGRILHANAAGYGMLDERSVIRASSGKLTALDAETDRVLHDIFMNSRSGDAAVGAKGIAVPLTGRDGGRYVAHALPLTSGARRRLASPIPPSPLYSCARPPSICRTLWRRSQGPSSLRRPRCGC